MFNSRPAHSLESDLKILSGLFVCVFSGLYWLLCFYAGWGQKVVITGYVPGILLLVAFLIRTYKRILQPLDSLANVIESIRLEDYSISSRSTYQAGVMPHLLTETAKLVAELQQRKDRYTQHIYLIYRLIEQLDSPVMVFDDNLRLTHGNSAFSDWFGQPWRNNIGISAKRLGLERNSNGAWTFTNLAENGQWQIKQSCFLEDKNQHQLLILNNIESELRQAQQDSWQQIIRVLSHEIRNSLTPIKAMTELLLEDAEVQEKQRIPLEVIETRSDSLLQFIDRYAGATKPVVVHKSRIRTQDLVTKMTPLFSDHKIVNNIEVDELLADPVLLEQVLINLLRNAAESHGCSGSDDAIEIVITASRQHCKIEIKDRGIGIANPDNLFVPFYTTKKQGQGIGLVFCGNVIEQHGGTLTLKNRNQGGAVASVNLPNT